LKSISISSEMWTKYKRPILLYLSYYPLDYGMGAAASVFDLLLDLPESLDVIVIEPHRIDLPHAKIELPTNVKRVKILIPLNRYSSVLYPLLTLFYLLKILKKEKPDIIMSMHHPFHILSLLGSILCRIFRIPHVVDVRDVWNPFISEGNFINRISDVLEKISSRFFKNDLIIFVCNEQKKMLEIRAKIKFRKTLIFPNCVSRTLVDRVIAQAKQQPLKCNNIIRFIFVGRVGKEYKLHKIYSIFEKLCYLRYNPILIIVGHVQDELRNNNIIYLGPRSREETLKLILESDIGVGPLGPTYAAPRKVIEYLVLGKIVIVGRNAVSKDLVKEYPGKILELPEDSTKMDEFIAELINKLEESRQKQNKSTSTLNKLFCRTKILYILRNIKRLQQYN